MSIVSCDSYCDTCGICQNGIHYDQLAVIRQSCHVTENSYEVNKCWLQVAPLQDADCDHSTLKKGATTEVESFKTFNVSGCTQK